MAATPLNLNLATFASPVFIAEQHPVGARSGYSYFYNGHVVYSFHRQAVAIFPELNPDTLKVKPYGIADAAHVVVGDQLFPVKPGKFKRIGKHDHFYFIKNDELFRPQGQNCRLVAVEGADVKTLKVIDEDLAEDKDHVFFNRNLQGLRKDQLGEYQIRDYTLMLVHGEQALYILGQRVDVDAASVRFVDKKDVQGWGAVLHAQDTAGELCILVDLRAKQGERRVKVVRGAGVNAAAEAQLTEWEAKAQAEKRKSPLIPGDFNASLAENISRLGQWFSEDFADKWDMQKSNLSLYRLVATYLKWCGEAYGEDGNVAHLEHGFALFKRFSLYSWLCPEILHHAAHLYVEAGQTAEALECCETAFQFRYAKFAELLADESLQSLHVLPEFSQLEKAFAASGDDYKCISLALLDASEESLRSHAEDEPFSRWMRQYLLYQFRFYQQSELQVRVQRSRGVEQASWQLLAQKNQFYFEHYMLLEGPHEVISPQGKLQWEAFLRYHEYAQLEPQAYLRMADILFCEAHQWASWKHKHFADTRQVLAPRIEEAGQLLAYFRELAAELTAERKAELLESAKGLAMVQIMQASGKPLFS